MRLLCFVSLISCFTFLAASTVAQERRPGEDFGGIAFKVAPPVGDFGDAFNIGWGISAMNEYVIFKNWSISFDITYLRWGAKPNELIENFTMIAFTAAPKVYVWSNVYLSVEVGGFYGTTEAKRGPRFEERYQFGVVPVVGYHKGMWDFAVEYALVRNRNWVNLRAGFYLLDFQLN
jgi:hypothetical protein